MALPKSGTRRRQCEFYSPPEDYDTLTIIDPNVKRESLGDKAGVLDVKLKTKSGKIIDVEIQVDSYLPLRERIAYYVSKMITEQIGKGQKYNVIKRVISVVIMDFAVLNDSPDYHHTFRMYDAKHDVELTDLVEIHTLELLKLPIQRDGSELWSWLKLFNTQREEDVTMLAKQKPMLRKVVGILQELSHDERTRLLYEQQEKWRMDYESSMSNATRIGLTKGLEEGLEKAMNSNSRLLPTRKFQAYSRNPHEPVCQRVFFNVTMYVQFLPLHTPVTQRLNTIVRRIAATTESISQRN